MSSEDVENLSSKIIYHILYNLRQIVCVEEGQDTTVDLPPLSKGVLPNKDKEPNYVIREVDRYTVYTEIIDSEYERKRDAVRYAKNFLGIDLESAGEALDYYLSFFTGYDLDTLKTCRFNRVYKDTPGEKFAMYKPVWLEWIENFSSRILLDPMAIEKDLKFILELGYFSSPYSVNNSLFRLKKFLPKLIIG